MSEQYNEGDIVNGHRLTGGQWVPVTSDYAAPPAPSAPPAAHKKSKRKWPWVVGGVAVLLVIGSVASGSGGSTPSADQPTPTPTATSPSTPAPATSTPEAAPTTPEPPQLTLAQEQVVQAAQSYLDMGGFSEKGLIQQLSSSYGEGFSKAQALFAIKYLKPNWNQQAVVAAKSYLEMGGFSRASLLDQLTSSYGEGFTQAQALYALKAVGY